MRQVPESVFSIYALSLPRGHDFGDHEPIDAWLSDDNLTLAVARRHNSSGELELLVMRRRVDSVWVVAQEGWKFRSEMELKSAVEESLQNRDPEPLPQGSRPRPSLSDTEGREPSGIFKNLCRRAHHRTAWLFNQLYLSLPNPDKNWVSDCQTANFHTRLWELQLLASFREQGLLVTQPHPSPDFRVENKRGQVAWVEAVTCNPVEAYDHANSEPTAPPDDPHELLFGRSAVRFAKTIGNKIAKQYDRLAHVAQQPFALAIADFQEPGSMVWSREALPAYLYGQGAKVVERSGKKVAASYDVDRLLGPSEFPAGLFANQGARQLSAVIFSNACSLAKFARIAATRMGAIEGIRYTRVGRFADPAPDALMGIPFCLDIVSEEYRSIWPHGYEPWCAELEVFHNPFADHPLPMDLMPECTHWILMDGDIGCISYHERNILWSRTIIQNSGDDPVSIENLMSFGSGDDNE